MLCFVYVASNSFVFVHCLRKDKIKEIFGCLFTQIAWVTRIKHGRLKGITFNGGSVEDANSSIVVYLYIFISV